MTNTLAGDLPHTEHTAAEERVRNAAPELLEALSDLAILVRAECPRLLDDDRGGDYRLDARIDAAIAKALGTGGAK